MEQKNKSGGRLQGKIDGNANARQRHLLVVLNAYLEFASSALSMGAGSAMKAYVSVCSLSNLSNLSHFSHQATQLDAWNCFLLPVAPENSYESNGQRAGFKPTTAAAPLATQVPVLLPTC